MIAINSRPCMGAKHAVQLLKSARGKVCARAAAWSRSGHWRRDRIGRCSLGRPGARGSDLGVRRGRGRGVSLVGLGVVWRQVARDWLAGPMWARAVAR